MPPRKSFDFGVLADRARYLCYAVSVGLMIPWFGQFHKVEVLAGGGLQGIEPATTKLLLYLFVGYPFFLLGSILLSLWFIGQNRAYHALVASTLPLFYFAFMLFTAKQLIAAVTAAMKGKIVSELVGMVPFEYMVPGPVPILPGRTVKGILQGFF